MNVTVEVPVVNRGGKTVKLEAIAGMGEVGIELPVAMLRNPRVRLDDLEAAIAELKRTAEPSGGEGG